MHIAAADPKFVRREEVTEEVLDRERELFKQQALESGKPENVIDRIIEGKIDKFYAESVLLEQAFVKDSDQTIQELIGSMVGKLGENIQVRRFSRFALGAE
jgi:elongation factor Ts